MNFYFTATPPSLVNQTVNTLTSHGHTIVGQPHGPYTDVSLLRTDPSLGPQLLAGVGATPTGWIIVVSQV